MPVFVNSSTPAPTASHIPIPHFRVVDLVKTAVGMYGHGVTAEHFGVTEDGMRFFGLLSLKSPYTGLRGYGRAAQQP